MLNDDTKRAQALGLRAQYEADTGNSTAACASAAKAIALADAAGTPEAALGARIEWTNVLQSRGDHSEALLQAEQCLALSRAAGERSGESAALNQLAIAAARRGSYSLSRDYAEQALQLARNHGDRSVECVVLCNLGDNEREVGNFGVAMDRLQTGLRVAREIGWRHLELHILCIMSTVVLSTLSDSEEALTLAKQASAIDFELADRNFFARALLTEGHAYASLGDASAAVSRYLNALQIFRDLNSFERQPNALAELAQAEMKLGRTEDAMAHISELLHLLDVAEHKESIDDLLWVYYSCHQVLRAGGAAQAGDLLRRAHDLLIQQARSLNETDRESFLGNVPLNRAIQAAWAGI